ncbi:MAG: transcriptional repressor [Nocardioidaceae bacterium]
MSTETAPRAFAEIGRRDTRQRRALREHLASSETFVSAQQLYDELRAGGDKVGLATVYRTLQAMTEAGEVDAVRTDDGETLYRKCGPRHHHHLVCRNCGLTVELAGPGVERWAAKSAEDNGFTDVKHVVELFGLCADCS